MFQLHTTSHGLHGPGARSGSCPVRILLRGHRGVGNCYRFDSFRVTSLEHWSRDGKFTPQTVVDLNILGAPPTWQQLWRAFLLLLIDPSLVLSSFRMLWGGGTSRYGMSTGFMMVSVHSSIEWRLVFHNSTRCISTDTWQIMLPSSYSVSIRLNVVTVSLEPGQSALQWGYQLWSSLRHDLRLPRLQ